MTAWGWIGILFLALLAGLGVLGFIRWEDRAPTVQAPDARGVYVIYSPKGKVMHVGGTPRGRRGLRQRLKNHLHGSSSFVKKCFSGKGSKLRAGYQFGFLKVPNPRLRVLLEHYAVGMLCPKHVGLGESVKRPLQKNSQKTRPATQKA